MRKIGFTIVSILVLTLCVSVEASAKKKYPVIKFETTTIDMGVFSEEDPVRTVTFKFHNVGKADLVINYVHPSCGCTEVEYPKKPIPKGGSGEIVVTYDGTNKLPGKVSKHVQVFTNCKDDLVRIFIKGEMTPMPKQDLD